MKKFVIRLVPRRAAFWRVADAHDQRSWRKGVPRIVGRTVGKCAEVKNAIRVRVQMLSLRDKLAAGEEELNPCTSPYPRS